MPDDSELANLADHLAEQHYQLLYELVRLRGTRGLSLEEVADRMGVSTEEAASFERYWADPNLSVIRRYAMAVGARIEHTVTLAPASDVGTYRHDGDMQNYSDGFVGRPDVDHAAKQIDEWRASAEVEQVKAYLLNDESDPHGAREGDAWVITYAGVDYAAIYQAGRFRDHGGSWRTEDIEAARLLWRPSVPPVREGFGSIETQRTAKVTVHGEELES